MTSKRSKQVTLQYELILDKVSKEDRLTVIQFCSRGVVETYINPKDKTEKGVLDKPSTQIFKVTLYGDPVGYVVFRIIGTTTILDLICTRNEPGGGKGYGKRILHDFTHYIKTKLGQTEVRILSVYAVVFYYLKLGFRFTDSKYENVNTRHPEVMNIIKSVMMETVPVQYRSTNTKIAIWTAIFEKLTKLIKSDDDYIKWKGQFMASKAIKVELDTDLAVHVQWILESKTSDAKELKGRIFEAIYPSFKTIDGNLYMVYDLSTGPISIENFCDVCYTDNPKYEDLKSGYAMCSSQCLDYFISNKY